MIRSVLISKEEKTEIYNPISKLIVNLEEYFIHNEYNKELLQVYFDLLTFMKIAEFYDERYITYIEKKDKNIFILL